MIKRYSLDRLVSNGITAPTHITKAGMINGSTIPALTFLMGCWIRTRPASPIDTKKSQLILRH